MYPQIISELQLALWQVPNATDQHVGVGHGDKQHTPSHKAVADATKEVQGCLLGFEHVVQGELDADGLEALRGSERCSFPKSLP